MELTVADVAREHSRTQRFVQMALAAGDLAGHRVLGRTTTVDDIAARAWGRALARGRRWAPDVRDAALDLLSGRPGGRLSGSERSRLRSRLRGMTAGQIAHAAGGLGRWARYRGDAGDALMRIGPSALPSGALDLVDGAGWMTFAQVSDLTEFEIEHDVILDADGNLGIVQRARSDERIARVLLDTYLLGDARQSAAAAAELERQGQHV